MQDTSDESLFFLFLSHLKHVCHFVVLLQNLSLERSKQRSSRQLHTPGSKQLSEKSHRPSTATDEEPVFAESWPSTEWASSPASTSTSSNMEVPKPSARVGKSPVSTEQGVQQDSVLAKYALGFMDTNHAFTHNEAHSQSYLLKQNCHLFCNEKSQYAWHDET